MTGWMGQLSDLFAVIYRSLLGFTETSYCEILRAQLDTEPAAQALCESPSIQNGNSSAAIAIFYCLILRDRTQKWLFEPEIERLRKRRGKEKKDELSAIIQTLTNVPALYNLWLLSLHNAMVRTREGRWKVSWTCGINFSHRSGPPVRLSCLWLLKIHCQLWVGGHYATRAMRIQSWVPSMLFRRKPDLSEIVNGKQVPNAYTGLLSSHPTVC